MWSTNLITLNIYRRANSRISEAINAIELNLQSSRVSNDEILSKANKYSEHGSAIICNDIGPSSTRENNGYTQRYQNMYSSQINKNYREDDEMNTSFNN